LTAEARKVARVDPLDISTSLIAKGHELCSSASPLKMALHGTKPRGKLVMELGEEHKREVVWLDLHLLVDPSGSPWNTYFKVFDVTGLPTTSSAFTVLLGWRGGKNKLCRLNQEDAIRGSG
jgi:hypothetical protein